MRAWWPFSIGSALALFAAWLACRWVPNDYFFFAAYVVLQFVALASAWNILGGYAGYVNFGASAFFAAGAYTAVALAQALDLPLLLQLAAAAAVAALLGFAAGALTLRLRGVYFSIATVALAVICETIALNWQYVGGARGIAVAPLAVPAGFSSHTRWLFLVMAAIAVLAIAAGRYVENSRLGRGLRGLRDDEFAAESIAVPTLRLKLIASTLSGGLMGLAGAPFAHYAGFVEPSLVFSLTISVSALAMPIIGGLGRWQGPVIGALLLASVQQAVTVTISSELNVLILGAVLVLFVIAAPQGLLGLWRRRAGNGTT